MYVKNIILSIFLLMIIILGYFLYSTYPAFIQVQKLQNHYISINTINGEVHYKLIKSKPANWISPTNNILARKTIQISEDWSFHHHSGIDLNQIKESISNSLFSKKKIRGASTISQQLVKNLFLTKDKTIQRKFKELIITLYMESVTSKNRILEIYLNIIEYGDNLYGIANASNYYFNKKYKKLTPKEAAFLAMLLPNPKRNSQSFRNKKLTPYATKIINNILHKLTIIKAINYGQEINYRLQRFQWELSYY